MTFFHFEKNQSVLKVVLYNEKENLLVFVVESKCILPKVICRYVKARQDALLYAPQPNLKGHIFSVAIVITYHIQSAQPAMINGSV